MTPGERRALPAEDRDGDDAVAPRAELTEACHGQESAAGRPGCGAGRETERAGPQQPERARRLLELERLVEHEPHVGEAVDHRAERARRVAGVDVIEGQPVGLHPLDRALGPVDEAPGGSPGGSPAARR